jgi:hypothetical protein
MLLRLVVLGLSQKWWLLPISPHPANNHLLLRLERLLLPLLMGRLSDLSIGFLGVDNRCRRL